jgi:hypothetical protein
MYWWYTGVVTCFSPTAIAVDVRLVRPTLQSGEHGPVHLVRVLPATEDRSAAGHAQGLVRGRRHDGDGRESREVDDSRVGAGSADDQLRLVSQGLAADGVVIQKAGLWQARAAYF